MEQKYGAQTVERALRLVQLVVSSPRRLTSAEIAVQLGVNKSAAYRLTRSLEDAGFLAREAQKRGYGLGSALLSLSASVMSKVDVRTAARPYLERITERFGETVSLHVRAGSARVCVETIEGAHPIRRVVPLGDSYPLYLGPSGKVIMAFLPEEEREELLRSARRDGLKVRKIESQLRAIRKDGFMAAVGDRTPTVGGLSAPLHNGLGVVGAITVSGPGLRWSLTEMLRAAPFVKEQARELSAQLGFREEVIA